MAEETETEHQRPPRRKGILALLIFAAVVALVFICQTSSLFPLHLRRAASLTPPPSAPSQVSPLSGAQATLAAGQEELTTLSGQATIVSRNIARAQDTAADATLAAGERQLAELTVRRTEIAQEMAAAAETQQASAQSTKIALDATATAEALAAIATRSVSEADATETAIAMTTAQRDATQTAEALAAQATRTVETVQAGAAETASPLTATAAAALAGEAVRAQQQAERRANWEAFVLGPLLIGLLALVVVVVLGLAVSAYRRLIPVIELRLRALGERRPRGREPLLLLDGKVVEREPVEERAPPPRLRSGAPSPLPNAGTVNVEIADPSEPPIDFWIAEAEEQLWSSRRASE